MKATHKKIIAGPGGIRCECCRCGSLKESRVMLNRRTRRIDKVRLHVEFPIAA